MRCSPAVSGTRKSSGLPAEVLAIEIEAPVLLLVVDDGANQAVVDP